MTDQGQTHGLDKAWGWLVPCVSILALMCTFDANSGKRVLGMTTSSHRLVCCPLPPGAPMRLLALCVMLLQCSLLPLPPPSSRTAFLLFARLPAFPPPTQPPAPCTRTCTCTCACLRTLHLAPSSLDKPSFSSIRNPFNPHFFASPRDQKRGAHHAAHSPSPLHPSLRSIATVCTASSSFGSDLGFPLLKVFRCCCTLFFSWRVSTLVRPDFYPPYLFSPQPLGLDARAALPFTLGSRSRTNIDNSHPPSSPWVCREYKNHPPLLASPPLHPACHRNSGAGSAPATRTRCARPP